jgi:lipopolysaccharide export system protein LptA
MTRRSAFRYCVAILLVTACGRSGRVPETGPLPPPAPADTQAARILQEQREDSVRRAAETAPTVAVPEPAIKPRPDSTLPPQERRCILDLTNTDDTRVQYLVDPGTGRRFTYLGGGVRGRCRNQDITIEADSAESYEGSDLHLLIGRVRYREPRYAIDSDRATYFRAEERILFERNVHVKLSQQQATMDGPHLEYFRPIEGVRPQARMVARQRPRLTYIERDSAGVEQPPAHVDANTIVADGDSTFHASGQVRLERTDILATSDSATLDASGQFARLLVGPVIRSTGEKPFTLTGRVVNLHGTEREVNRVVAIDSGRAVSDDFTLTADTIDLRMETNRLQRAFAFGNTGAYAITPGRDVIADSMDIIMPGQRIRELRAIGKAYAESDPDSLRIVSDERDWIRGDTLIALFDSAAAGDTTQPRLLELFASGEASAYYQIAPDSGDRSRPGVNYVTGRVLRLEFADGEVESVTVTDQVSGVYLAPLPPGATGGTGTNRPPGTPPPIRPQTAPPGARRP